MNDHQLVSKNVQGTGCAARLVKAPDVYELRVYVGRDSSGRVKYRYERFTGNKRSAQRALAALVAEVAHAREVAEPESIWASSTTLNAAFAAWKLNGWQDLSPSTTRRYESIWQVHVERSIGLRKISELSAHDFERFFRKLKADGLAEASVRQTRAILNRTCRLVRRWSGGVLPNPVAETELPSWSMDADRVVRAPEATEVAALLRACADEDPRVAAFVRVVRATGTRSRLLCLQIGGNPWGGHAASCQSACQRNRRELGDPNSDKALVTVLTLEDRQAGSGRARVFPEQPQIALRASDGQPCDVEVRFGLRHEVDDLRGPC